MEHVTSREIRLFSGRKVWVKYPPLSFDEFINLTRDVVSKALANPNEVYEFRSADIMQLFVLIFKLEEEYTKTFVPEASQPSKRAR